jgi:hypothetical protein
VSVHPAFLPLAENSMNRMIQKLRQTFGDIGRSDTRETMTDAGDVGENRQGCHSDRHERPASANACMASALASIAKLLNSSAVIVLQCSSTTRSSKAKK